MKVLVLVLIISVAYARHEQYIGWKSYRISPNNKEQLQSVTTLIPRLELDFLSYATVQSPGVVLVKPEHQAEFSKALNDAGVSYEVHTEDIKLKLDFDDAAIESRRNAFARSGKKELPYDNYQRLETIYAYVDDIAARHPGKATLVNAGPTPEGRPIKYLKISTTNFEDLSKPVIFIDGGMHAREWITPPAVTWAIHKLLDDVTEPDLLDRFDWILIPVANPDGYEYSFTNERFWRKTRSTDQHTASIACPGVDGNRNFDFFWNTVGTSSHPCTDTYGGSRPFSEIETRVIRDLLDEHLARVALYMTMHSYGSMILYPWGHDGSLSNNALALHTVGVTMADAIFEKALPHFPRYVVGNAALVLWYGASGAAEDYAHWVGVPLSYTYELPGLQPMGTFEGFHLNPIYIEQVARETWEGIAVGARRAGDLF